jgi:hypothetical protein
MSDRRFIPLWRIPWWGIGWGAFLWAVILIVVGIHPLVATMLGATLFTVTALLAR